MRDPQEKTKKKEAFILSHYEFHSAERIVSMNDYSSSSTTRAASTHVCQIISKIWRLHVEKEKYSAIFLQILSSPSQTFVLWKKKFLKISTFLQNNLISVEAAKILWYPDM